MKTHALTAVAVALTLAACNRSEPAPSNDEVFSTENTMNAETGSATETATIDSAFVTDAMKGDNGEVAIGQLAQTQGESQAVKDYGELLATDHGAHKQQLAALARASGVPVTNEPSEEGKANLDKLKKLHGAAFDKEFKEMMVEDHTKDIAKYEIQAKSADAQTATLAQKTLPTLRKHLDTANAL